MKMRYGMFFLLFISVHSLSLQASDIYPAWFIYPRDYEQLIIGYTYNGLPALDDAESMYCAFNECIVLGTLEVFKTSSYNKFLKESNYFYYFSRDSVERIHGKLFAVDSFDVNIITGDRIVAYSLSDTLSTSYQRLKGSELPRPGWLDKTFMQNDRYYFGVGMYTAIGNENDGWKTAEEQAIFTILTNLAIQVHKINITTREEGISEAAMEQISVLKLKYLLRNIRVLERFPDRTNKLYYVLVRIPKNGVVSPMLR